MPGVRGERVGSGHVGALFALCERQQFEGAEELQSLQRRPLALCGPGREFPTGQGGHASTTDGHVTPPTVIGCADDREATGMPAQLTNGRPWSCGRARALWCGFRAMSKSEG
jgi:hypothetical protein